MKGIVFNLLEEVVRRARGEDAWDDLLDEVQVEGAYTSLGSYPDAELFELVRAASGKFGLPEDAVVRWFGRQALPLLAERFPGFFQGHSSTRSFVLTLNDIIHPEVRKIYPGAEVPEFAYDTSSEEVLVLSYQSQRGLCALAEGLIEGAAAHYGQVATIEQTCCVKRSDDRCQFRVTFADASG